ncbi:MAG TPA: sigma-70 family RNA polymerase sigma factor [Candidatus Dormibacteraeota bacterium]
MVAEEQGTMVDESRAFEALMEKYARSMLQYADFVLHDLSAAEDALQEAFVIAWRRRKSLRETSAFGPWLRRIVLRECLRWRRRPWMRWLTLTEHVVSRGSQPDATEHLDVGRAVARLSPQLRAVIFLHFFEDLTLKAIATELRIPEGTVKSRLYEGLRRLEDSLADYSTPSEQVTR